MSEEKKNLPMRLLVAHNQKEDRTMVRLMANVVELERLIALAKKDGSAEIDWEIKNHNLDVMLEIVDVEKLKYSQTEYFKAAANPDLNIVFVSLL